MSQGQGEICWTRRRSDRSLGRHLADYGSLAPGKFKLPAKEFALKFLLEERVALVPGMACGACGAGFVRCASATNLDILTEAMVRLMRFIGKL